MLKFYTFILALFIFVSPDLFPQWPIDLTTNMTICDTTGEQTLTKNYPTSDGGCYISWFDSRSGMYALYLQKLDAQGNKLFPPNGLLISNNPQDSWLVDYDLAVDNNDNAILAFADIRLGTGFTPFAYKISPTGEFLWGPNGVNLVDDTVTFQPNPKIACTDDGNYFFVWMYAADKKQVAMQKLNAAGEKQFMPTAIYLQGPGDENYDWPWHIASNNGSVILMWSGYSGPFFSPVNYRLYSQKFSSSGQPVWNTTQDTIYALGHVAGFYTPRIFSDGNGGAIYCWHDSRNQDMIENSYVQRQTSDGMFLFQTNGAPVAVGGTDQRLDPIAAIMPETNETYVFWHESDQWQTMTGIFGQRLDAQGNRRWTDDGKIFRPMDENNFSSLFVLPINGRVYAFFNDILLNNICTVKGFACDSLGTMLWQGNNGVINIGCSETPKIRMWASRVTDGMFILSWEDQRIDEGGIYAQNMYTSGLVPVELTSLRAAASGNSVIINWSTATEKNNRGFNVERKFQNNQWLAVAYVPGNGTSINRHDYSFTDKNLAPGIYQYRLKQTDFNGTSVYSDIVKTEVLALRSFTLSQNYPNPFNPSTVIRYDIPQKGNVILRVYDVIGNKVLDLVNGEQESGSYEITFDASKLSTGVYFYQLKSGTYNQTRKMLLIK